VARGTATDDGGRRPLVVDADAFDVTGASVEPLLDSFDTTPVDLLGGAPVEHAPGEGDGAPASGLPKRFGRNVFMNYAAQAVTSVASVVSTPLLLHHLGQSAFGVWILASSVVTYLQVFAAGFGGATTKLVAEDAAERPQAALRTLNTTFFVLVPMALVALAVGCVLAFFFPSIVHVPTSLHDKVIIAVAVLSVGLAAALPCDTFGGALLGYQRFDLLSISNALLVAVTTAASIAIVVFGGGIVPLAIATTVISVALHFVRFRMLVHIQPGTKLRRSLVDRQQRRKAVRLSGWFLLLSVLTAIYNTLCDVLIVGIVLGARAAAIYAVGSRLAKAAMQALDSLSQVFFPHASHTARNEAPGALAAVTVDATRVTLVGGTMAGLVFLVLASPGIRDWVGPGYTTSAHVLVVLAIAVALGSPFRPLYNIMTGMGRMRSLAAVRGGEVAVNLVSSVILVHVLGPVGAAWGTLVGVVLFRLPVGLVVGCRAIGIKVRTLLWRSVVPHLLPMAASAAVLVALLKVAEHSVVGLFVDAALGCVAYLAVYFATGATPGDRQRLMGYVQAVRHRGGGPGPATTVTGHATEVSQRSPEP